MDSSIIAEVFAAAVATTAGYTAVGAPPDSGGALVSERISAAIVKCGSKISEQCSLVMASFRMVRVIASKVSYPLEFT